MANLPYSKDANAYTDPEILNEERKTFFHEGWVSIGLASTLGPGTVIPAEVAGQPVIITRTQEGNLHVFHNICRHKKLQLVLDSCTDLAHLVCPYHAWT